MGCKTEDTKTRYQNIKLENIKTILKHWNKPNSVLAEKTKLSIPTICNYKRQIKENIVDGKLLLNFEHGNALNKNGSVWKSRVLQNHKLIFLSKLIVSNLNCLFLIFFRVCTGASTNS